MFSVRRKKAGRRYLNYLEWIDCEERMPEQKQDGNGTVSETVKVILSDGTESEDWLINGKWVVHCKKNGGAYPVKWREM